MFNVIGDVSGITSDTLTFAPLADAFMITQSTVRSALIKDPVHKTGDRENFRRSLPSFSFSASSDIAVATRFAHFESVSRPA